MLVVNVIKSIGKNVDVNGVNISLNGRRNEEVRHRIEDARKVSGALQKLWKKRQKTEKAKV